jgi:AraC-like DNA-binding protein
MSTGHFSRSFKAAFGESPYSYLMTRRIERAKALLRRGDMSITHVCFAVGLDDRDATFEHIRAGGGEVVQEPIDQFYGVRDCAFRDPSGNMIRSQQPLAVAHEARA